MVRIISLANSPRRETFHVPPPDFRFDWGFHDASTQLDANLVHDQRQNIRNTRSIMTQAELGCYSSHVNVWRAFINSDFQQLLVVEDDVYVDWPMVELICKHNWEELGVSYLKLFAKIPATFRRLRGGWPFFYFHLIQYTSMPLGTQIYLLSKNAASMLEKSGRSVSRPIDMYMDRPWSTGVPIIGLFPPVAIEVSMPSSIGHERYLSHDNSLSAMLNYYTYRASEKLRQAAYVVRPHSISLSQKSDDVAVTP